MLNMKENGFKVKKSDKEKEDKFGLMGRCMKDGGKRTKPTAKDASSMLMVMCTMDSGKMTRPTASVYTAILTALNMKAIGKRISSMEMVLKHGQMVQSMKDNMYKEKSMVLEDLHGLTEAPIMANSLKIIFKAKENIIGQMEESIMVSGSITKWKEVESSHGLTAEDTKEIT